jgi:CheY-like chemotaxis protein
MAKVLVVEDDPWSQRIVRDLLEMRGHQVVVASDVDEARGQLPDVPDVVLLDIHVPGGGGELLLREIRERGNSALPVIALTASAMRGDRERFLRQGFTAYVSKPIDVQTFARTVEDLARGGR